MDPQDFSSIEKCLHLYILPHNRIQLYCTRKHSTFVLWVFEGRQRQSSGKLKAEPHGAETPHGPNNQGRCELPWHLDLRLDLYSDIPPVLREQSKTILHHWARCLYKSAEVLTLSEADKQKRIELAIEKLKIIEDSLGVSPVAKLT
jgi:hypothetical protein